MCGVLTRISMISDSYAGYLISGTKKLDVEKATKAINEAHALDIPFRLKPQRFELQGKDKE